ncbi:MAG: extensin family protein [Hyphomicrobiales bacterium]|nr:MAG: extensin family protein [Hyphomicrobiales bacterium]
MSAVAKWIAEARRRGGNGVERMSSLFTLAAAFALVTLPAVPYVASHWGPRPDPIAAAIAPPPAALAPPPQDDGGVVEMVRAKPVVSEPAPSFPVSPTEQERAQIDAAAAQQRVGFKPASRADKPPAPPAQAATPPPQTPQQPATEPEHWTEAEVATALKTCVQILGPIAANVETLAPIRQDKCGTPAPVALKRVGSGASSVELSPPAVINCAMVARISDWVEKVLQPAARDTFGASVIRLNSTSGYVCRGRNGDMLPSGKISEHALANALDVASFTLSDGRTIDVGKHWGPTKRDHKADLPAPPRAPLPAPAKVGRGAAMAAPSAEPAKAPAPPDATSKEAQFLRHLHEGACKLFGTVLGPEANEAHREHFHFDLYPRKHTSYCQ